MLSPQTSSIFSWILRSKFLICCCVFFSSHLFAETFVLSGKTFSISTPPEWVVKKGILNLPVAVLSPVQKDSTRAVVSFSGPDSAFSSAELDPAFVKDLTEKIKSSRVEWAKKNDYEIKEFLPSEFKVLPQGQRLVTGLRYQRKSKEKIEKSFFITCSGAFVTAKVLVTSSNSGFLPEAESIIESLSCK